MLNSMYIHIHIDILKFNTYMHTMDMHTHVEVYTYLYTSLLSCMQTLILIITDVHIYTCIYLPKYYLDILNIHILTYTQIYLSEGTHTCTHTYI